MKSKKSIVRILAVILAAVLSAGMFGCINSYNNNPIVAKVGGVELDLNRFYSLYNNTDTNSNPYYAYMQYGAITREQYANYIIEDLVNYGVQLDQVEKQNITLDSEEEAKLQEDVDNNIKEYAVSTYGSKVDASITDEDAKAAAALELLKKELTDNGASFEDYRKSIEESLRKTAQIDKLRKIAIGEFEVTVDDIKKYYEENSNAVTVSSFNSAFQSFISAASTTIPLFMPHPEKEVEDDPETTDKDEHKDADPTAAIFSVQHLLMKFATEATDEDAKDLKAYAEKDEKIVTRMNELEASLSGLTVQQFIEKCHDKELCDDPGMLQPSYQYFGYMMQKDLISSYYDGFGYASMKLRFGHDWEPAVDSDKTADASATEAPAEEPKDYGVEFLPLADGEVAKVYTKAGVHYIVLNPNSDCYDMYDDEGYFMVPVYENDELVKEGNDIKTVNGTMTQAQFDLINKILENVKENIEIKDDDAENKTNEDSEEPENNDEEEEEEKVFDLKSVFDNLFDAKKAQIESERYAAAFKEWKDSTKIKVYRNILKPFIKG